MPRPRPPETAREKRWLVKVRLRLAWIADAEEACRKRNGRPLTIDDLEREIGQYPGDV
jgi:hypothetical protein